MKNIKIIVPIMAIILQMTLAIPLPYSKSENSAILNKTTSVSPDEAINIFKQGIDLIKDLSQRIDGITTNILKSMEQLKDVNTSETYKQYKATLEEFSKYMHKIKTVEGNCVIKFLFTCEVLNAFIEEFRENDKPNNLSSEELEMKKLFQQHGLKDLINDFDNYANSFNIEETQKVLDNMSPGDSKKFKNIFKDLC